MTRVVEAADGAAPAPRTRPTRSGPNELTDGDPRGEEAEVLVVPRALGLPRDRILGSECEREVSEPHHGAGDGDRRGGGGNGQEEATGRLNRASHQQEWRSSSVREPPERDRKENREEREGRRDEPDFARPSP